MAVFHLKIAGAVGQVTGEFDSTPMYLKDYVTEEPAEFSLAVTASDRRFEQEDSVEEARREGLKPRIFPEPYLERAAIQRKFAKELLKRNILLLHGSVVAVDGKGYLFTAACGTGKSTHTRLWRQVYGNRAVMVNDDKPFLTVKEGEVLVSGSPWSGKHGIQTNITLPLQGICILQRGEENTIVPLEPAEALPMLLHQSFCPEEEELQQLREDLVHRIARQVPLWRMHCNMNPDAAELSHETMSKA